MMKTGVYEQIINRLFKQKLDKVDTDRFYVGKKAISKGDAVNILTKYLQHLIETAFIDTADDENADKYTNFINSVIKTLGTEFKVERRHSSAVVRIIPYHKYHQLPDTHDMAHEAMLKLRNRKD